ncbi:MAG: cyclic dehypoxanthinyl futalosine synthase [Planctomycetia bacterium]|jgi:cyclic dehypoxanthinyl futalosine synthase
MSLVDSTIQSALNNALEEKRLTPEEGLLLLESNDLAAVAAVADKVSRRKHPERYRTYNIDRNINYTNVCESRCRFCAFSCDESDPEAYVISTEELYEKIRQTIELGGNQILLQGGLHPKLSIEWYEEMIRGISQNFPEINIHGFSPTEIYYLAQQSKLPVREVLLRLREAGLGSLPGGGAEILVDRVRRLISPQKVSAGEWLDVCREWHRLGGRGSATMMFGHIETYAERIEHLDRLRALQDETGGFTAFIPWTFQPSNTTMHKVPKVHAFEYLKMLAVSRIYLDNFDNLQASWVTQGLKVGQIALHFGANDMGSLMIEENVVAATGVHFSTTEESIRKAIETAGYHARRRDVFYRLVS